MLRRILVNALALGAAAILLGGITVSGPSVLNRIATLVVVALIFGALNSLVKPVLKLFSLPFIVLSLGLFLIVINGAMLLITSWVCAKFGIGFHVAGWGSALMGSLIISAVAWAASGWAQDNGERHN